MSFLNSLLFVGSKKEYCLVDIAQGRSVKDICEISKNTIYPFCIPIQQYDGTINSSFGETENDNNEQGEMLLANDRKGLFYDFVGSPARGVFSILFTLFIRKVNILNGSQMLSVVCIFVLISLL